MDAAGGADAESLILSLIEEAATSDDADEDAITTTAETAADLYADMQELVSALP
tara:strand:- start:14596 stop:14757 length:162 start_codon:yes stop_codon:yes gene_type:complete